MTTCDGCGSLTGHAVYLEDPYWIQCPHCADLSIHSHHPTCPVRRDANGSCTCPPGWPNEIARNDN